MRSKIFSLAIIVFSIILLWVSTNYFVVKNVECSISGQEPCKKELQDPLNKALIGSSLFFTNFQKILFSEPFSSLPYTLNSYEKRLPSTISVTFNEEPLQYLLKTGDGQQLAVGDAGTIVTAPETESGFPQVTIAETADNLIQNLQLKQHFHQPISTLINSLYKQQIIFQNVEWISDEEIIVTLDTGVKVFFEAKDPASAAQKLAIILDSQEIEDIDEPIREIDLRFEMPVLRTNQ